jgi:hypothetical protein
MLKDYVTGLLNHIPRFDDCLTELCLMLSRELGPNLQGIPVEDAQCYGLSSCASQRSRGSPESILERRQLSGFGSL